MRGPNRLIFINCPFDSDHSPIFEAIVFAISACGYEPRCASELLDSGHNRLTKIIDLLDRCDFSLHDISRTELNSHGLPRFNMPFELGLALGLKHSKRTRAAPKLLVLERESDRYLEYLSDFRGCDPVAHDRDPTIAIGRVRDWLSCHQRILLTGPNHVKSCFARFRVDLPRICAEAGWDRDRMAFRDLTHTIRYWLAANVPLA